MEASIEGQSKEAGKSLPQPSKPKIAPKATTTSTKSNLENPAPIESNEVQKKPTSKTKPPQKEQLAPEKAGSTRKADPKTQKVEPSPKKPVQPKRSFTRVSYWQKTPKKKNRFYDSWFDFYFRRTSVDGCRMGGILRILFAVIFLFDHYLLQQDLEFLLSPFTGVLASFRNVTNATTGIAADPISWSLFDVEPQSEDWIWQLHWVSMGQGVLLLLGILPRFQLLGLYLYLVSLHRHNELMLDDEDTLLRLWCFFLLLLPLHHFTIYDVFRKFRRCDESWPMWPWRLWQTEMCLIYWSSSVQKLLHPHGIWITGQAFYWLTHSAHFYPGLFNPDLFFNRAFPLKLSCWYLLAVECTCWLGVWMKDLQADIIAIMIVAHLVLEVSTNRLGFNLLAITGWMTFMVQADYLPPLERRRWLRRRIPFELQPPRIPKGFSGLLLKLFVFLLTFGMAVDVIPSGILVGEKAQAGFHSFRLRYVEPMLQSIGLWQRPWVIYETEPFPETSYYQAFIQLRNGTVVDRRSPNWPTMTWWERKRTMRLKKFFTNLADDEAAWVSYCEHIIHDMEGDVLAIELVRLVSIVHVRFGLLALSYSCVSHGMISRLSMNERELPKTNLVGWRGCVSLLTEVGFPWLFFAFAKIITMVAKVWHVRETAIEVQVSCMILVLGRVDFAMKPKYCGAMGWKGRLVTWRPTPPAVPRSAPALRRTIRTVIAMVPGVSWPVTIQRGPIVLLSQANCWILAAITNNRVDLLFPQSKKRTKNCFLSSGPS